jgi:hypothetical protein
MKKLKNPVFILCVVLTGLSFFSCSDLFLPKRVEVKGSLSLPAKLGVANLDLRLISIMADAFSAQSVGGKPTTVYGVDYDGQTVQTLCIHIPIEMTQNLHPDHFLKTINRQLNNDLSDDPKQLFRAEPGIGSPYIDIPILNIFDNLANIAEISLESIASYVMSLEFAVCGGIETSGIGLNFHFKEIVPGIEMTLNCAELSIINQTKELKDGDNIFGNNKALTGAEALFIADPGSVKILRFETTLRSLNGPNDYTLRIDTSGKGPDEPIILFDGEMIFFQNWTKAVIDMEAAIIGQDNSKGMFPHEENKPFNLSALGGYFDGFIFEDMESRLYMASSPIKGLEPTLQVVSQYDSGNVTDKLFEGPFSSDSKPVVLEDGFLDGTTYIKDHLPGINENLPEYILDKKHMDAVFMAMPLDLRFMFTVNFHKDRYFDIYPDTFVEDETEDNSRIHITLMIMMPMHLRATHDGSTVSVPDLFDGVGDLLGRNKPGELFPSTDVRAMKMTVAFLEPMFFGGNLFIDGSKSIEPLLFNPDGIKLDKKGTSVNFTRKQLDIMKENIINPNVWIKFKENDEIIVPKDLGIMSVRFEGRGIIDIGELLE